MKTWIKCAIAATLGLAAGGTGGYFLGRELEKRDAEERLQTAIDEVKEVYRKDLPVVRETAADGPADASWGQKEAKQAAVTLDQEEMVKSQTAKPPLEQFIRDHTPANGAQRTNYAAIGLGVKQGPPPPPITNIKRIRELIAAGNYTEAAIVCDSVSQHMRNAEWHYLKSLIYLRQGSYNNAVSMLRIALQMDPANPEYTRLYNTLIHNQSRYGGFSSEGSGGYGCSMCDMCSGLLCADCLCECCGGDLISCC